MAEQQDIYSKIFIKNLFDEMSRTYGAVNLVSSFGVSHIWRRRCVSRVPSIENGRILDLMTGMGELFASIRQKFKAVTGVLAIDLSHEMCAQAIRQAGYWPEMKFEVREGDALQTGIVSGSVDCILSSFGLKTLSVEQEADLAREVARMLALALHRGLR